MWTACCPGASPETVSAILTPSGVCVSSAVPTFFPCESAKSAVAVLAVWARAAAKRERTARPVIKRFMASILLHFPSSTIIALGRRWFKGARRNHLTAARQCCRRSPRQVQAVCFRRRRRQGFRSPARDRVRALQPLFGPAPCGPGRGPEPRVRPACFITADLRFLFAACQGLFPPVPSPLPQRLQRLPTLPLPPPCGHPPSVARYGRQFRLPRRGAPGSTHADRAGRVSAHHTDILSS